MTLSINRKPEINLVVLGKGLVGTAWLQGLAEQQAKLGSFAHVRLVALANSSRFLVDLSGLKAPALESFQQASVAGDLSQLLARLDDSELTNIVVLDLTASTKVADHYLDFAQRGWHLISANKVPLTKSTERHKLLIQTLQHYGCFWGINATVGAALPVQASINELQQAGDRLHSLSGVFSGSLSYLLNRYDGKQSFTELVRQAKEAGVTEPDPRDDLSGTDVQRKLLILSRIAGFSINLDDIEVSPLLPKELLQGQLRDFWDRKTEIDSYMAKAYAEADALGLHLVYRAQAHFIDKLVQAKVGLDSAPGSDPLAQLTPCDNVFSLTTDFYQANPLVIRGPGAGALITATAVNIDLNKFALQLVAASKQFGHNFIERI